MALLVKLSPCSDPSETLLEGVEERPVISFRSDDIDPTVTLGRGQLTGISDDAIAEQVIQVSMGTAFLNDRSVRIELLQGATSVHVDGSPCRSEECVLRHGQTLSLFGLQYEYKLSVSDVPPKEDFWAMKPPAKRKSTDMVETSSISSLPSTSSGPPWWDAFPSDAVQLPKSTAGRLADEIQCSVCLEIQVHPRTLHPCGHSFCLQCLESLRQCPQCRKNIESHVPALQLDSLITTLVSVPSLLQADDVEHFRERQKNIPKSVAAVMQPRRKRPRSLLRLDTFPVNLVRTARAAQQAPGARGSNMIGDVHVYDVHGDDPLAPPPAWVLPPRVARQAPFLGPSTTNTSNSGVGRDGSMVSHVRNATRRTNSPGVSRLLSRQGGLSPTAAVSSDNGGSSSSAQEEREEGREGNSASDAIVID